MNRYLLDTNHLSAYLDRHARLEHRVDTALRMGHRIGICLPVLCEYRAGIRLGKHFQRNLARLQAALAVLRLWPCDDLTAAEVAELFMELRQTGQMLSQFDLLIASIARQHKLILLTADADFQRVPRLTVESWL